MAYFTACLSSSGPALGCFAPHRISVSRGMEATSVIGTPSSSSDSVGMPLFSRVSHSDICLIPFRPTIQRVEK